MYQLFREPFPLQVHFTPLDIFGDNQIKLQLIIDCSSIEVFGNNGEVVISDLIFPKE